MLETHGGLGADVSHGSANGWRGAKHKGSDGTGGLLIIYSKMILNNGDINSNGMTGGNALSSGGSSGGGSINIFYEDSYESSEDANCLAKGGNANGNRWCWRKRFCVDR